jgi:hypothetical protein
MELSDYRPFAGQETDQSDAEHPSSIEAIPQRDEAGISIEIGIRRLPQSSVKMIAEVV